jgi:hypothetical protein
MIGLKGMMVLLLYVIPSPSVYAANVSIGEITPTEVMQKERLKEKQPPAANAPRSPFKKKQIYWLVEDWEPVNPPPGPPVDPPGSPTKPPGKGAKPQPGLIR